MQELHRFSSRISEPNLKSKTRPRSLQATEMVVNEHSNGRARMGMTGVCRETPIWFSDPPAIGSNRARVPRAGSRASSASGSPCHSRAEKLSRRDAFVSRGGHAFSNRTRLALRDRFFPYGLLWLHEPRRRKTYQLSPRFEARLGLDVTEVYFDGLDTAAWVPCHFARRLAAFDPTRTLPFHDPSRQSMPTAGTTC